MTIILNVYDSMIETSCCIVSAVRKLPNSSVPTSSFGKFKNHLMINVMKHSHHIRNIMPPLWSGLRLFITFAFCSGSYDINTVGDKSLLYFYFALRAKTHSPLAKNTINICRLLYINHLQIHLTTRVHGVNIGTTRHHHFLLPTRIVD